MVRNYVRKTNKADYPRETLEEALEDIKSGRQNPYAASKKYRIPISTIMDHIKGRHGKKSKTLGRSTAIPLKEEKRCADALLKMQKYGFELSKNEVLYLVADFVKTNEIKTSFKDNFPGDEWFRGFKKRHNLCFKKKMDNSCNSFATIEDYFALLDSTIKELGLENEPARIWSVDGTSFYSGVASKSKSKVKTENVKKNNKVNRKPSVKKKDVKGNKEEDKNESGKVNRNKKNSKRKEDMEEIIQEKKWKGTKGIINEEGEEEEEEAEERDLNVLLSASASVITVPPLKKKRKNFEEIIKEKEINELKQTINEKDEEEEEKEEREINILLNASAPGIKVPLLATKRKGLKKIIKEKEVNETKKTINEEAEEELNVLLGASASGLKIPPLIIFKGKQIRTQWLAPEYTGYPGTTYDATFNGQMDEKVFENYFENSFLKNINLINPAPLLLLYAGPFSLITINLIEKASQHNVTVLKLPPNTISEFFEHPLGTSVFESLKFSWDLELTKWQSENWNVKLPKNEFSKMIGELWGGLSENAIRDGFGKAGVYRFLCERNDFVVETVVVKMEVQEDDVEAEDFVLY